MMATLIAAIFASTGFWTFLTKWLEMRKARKTPQTEMLLALVRDKLLYLNKKYRGLGYIPEEDFETYSALGQAYIKSGGNSMVKKGFEDNLKLPIKDEEEK